MYQAEGTFEGCQILTRRALLEAPEVRVPEWQSLDVTDKPMGITHELQNTIIQVPIPEDQADAVIEVEPNIPWAEEHFEERVSGIPHNPPPSHVNWPFAQAVNADHMTDEKFSHTYPERMWPKNANRREPPEGAKYKRMIQERMGIRFGYGDLADVVKQLAKTPETRQAFLPIWFPEDTGAVHGERVPCTLGYHFLIRDGRLNVTYFIRSCDFVRHFADDVYMAMRLGQWVKGRLVGNQGIVGVSENAEYPPLNPHCGLMMGTLTMHMVSLHVFGADIPKLRREDGGQG